MAAAQATQALTTAISLASHGFKGGSGAKVQMSEYQGQKFPMQRTAPDRLPKQRAEAIQLLEAELERCHAALLASPTAPLLTAEQRHALPQALITAGRAQPDYNIASYQQEAAFYFAEDTRRQQAATTPAPTK
ncbi:MAG: hypothetical protein ACRYF0_12745 [Janthinobacterium lividum]